MTMARPVLALHLRINNKESPHSSQASANLYAFIDPSQQPAPFLPSPDAETPTAHQDSNHH
jgi:hypothetical protein